MSSSSVRPVVLLVGIACQSPPPNAPVWSAGSPEPIVSDGPVDHVFAADLDGDGTDELGTVSAGVATIDGVTHTLTGAYQRAVAVPAGDREVAWLATGQGRDHREAPIQVTALSGAGAEVVFERPGDRDQVTDLRVIDGRVWAAMYADSRRVSGGWLDASGFDPVTREHMAQKQVPFPDGSVVVGRVYGTAPKSPGDLRRIPVGGAPTPLGSLRGVRALARADLDDDGHPDLVSGDGWHYAYGKEGDARVVLHHGPNLSNSRVIGWVPDSYAALHIEPVGTAPHQALVVQGSHRVVLLARDRLGWGVVDLGPIGELGTIAVLDAETAPRVAISGDKARIVPLTLATP